MAIQNIDDVLIANEIKAKIKNNSASSLPLNPSAQGWSATKIREKLYRAVCSESGDLDDNLLDVLATRLSTIKGILEILDANILLKADQTSLELLESQLEDGTITVDKADKDGDGLVIKSNYGVSLVLSYDNATNTLTSRLYASDGSLLDTHSAILTKSSSVADGLQSKEHFVKLQALPTNADLTNSLAGKVPQTRTILGLDLTNDILLDEFKTALGEAIEGVSGLMSATDKARLDALHALLGVEADADAVVNTINEVLAIFNTYPEGADLVSALGGKVDKVPGKGLSKNDFTDALKAKLDGLLNGSQYYNKEYIDALKDLNGWSSALLTPTALTNGGVITKATLSDYDVIKLFARNTATNEIDTDSFDTSVGLVNLYEYRFFDNADVKLVIADPYCTFTSLAGYELKIIGQKYEAQEAENVVFDKTIKNALDSENVQDAIDELTDDLSSITAEEVSYNNSSVFKELIKLGTKNINAELLDKSKLIAGGYISGSDGTIVSDSGFSYTDYISIYPSTTYSRIKTYRIAFYDKNKTYISGTNGTSFLTPANAEYLRLGIHNADIPSEHLQQVNTSMDVDTSLVYSTPYFNDLTVRDSKIVDGYLSKNLFDLNDVIDGHYVDNTNGEIVANLFFYTSNYIEIKPNLRYRFISCGTKAFYDKNKTYISGTGLSDYANSPSEGKYIRVSVYRENIINAGLFESNIYDEEFANFGVLNKAITLSSDYSNIGKLLVSDTLYVAQNKTLDIYFDNILEETKNEYEFQIHSMNIQGNNAKMYDDLIRFTYSNAGDTSYFIKAFKNGKLLKASFFNVVVPSTSAGNGITKKIMIIGDSTTDNTYLVPSLANVFSTDVMSVEFVGIYGTAPYKHMGISGAKTETFFGATSPFYDSGNFNFGKAISDHSLASPDYVFVNLGINDMFGLNDYNAQNRIIDVMSKYETMITSIKAFNSDIKVCICMTIPPCNGQSGFGVSYGVGETRYNYLKHNKMFVKSIVNQFSNRTDENIYIIPLSVSLDAEFNFDKTTIIANPKTNETIEVYSNAVHPNENGYKQIADIYYSFIKSFES